MVEAAVHMCGRSSKLAIADSRVGMPPTGSGGIRFGFAGSTKGLLSFGIIYARWSKSKWLDWMAWVFFRRAV